jgi:hypothetical protein
MKSRTVYHPAQSMVYKGMVRIGDCLPVQRITLTYK